MIVWVTWAQLVWALTVEATAAIRGRVARRTITLPGIQLAAGRLVATIGLIVASFGPAKPAVASPLPIITNPPTPAAVLVIDDPHTTPTEAAASVAEAAAEGPTFRVTSARQSYWSIAEDTSATRTGGQRSGTSTSATP